MGDETWLPVAGYEGSYEVSDLGRIRSIDRRDRQGRMCRGLVLKLRADRDGYLTFHTGRPRRVLRVHRLVLLAFQGPAPEGATEVRHVDGDPANNHLANLRWGTSAENKADQVRHGTHRNASKTHCPQGHPYDEANTYVPPGTNNRACRACARAHTRAVNVRRRQYKENAA